MFTETVTHAGGTIKGTASEAHAVMILRRAVMRGHTIEASADGGATITWTRYDTTGCPLRRSILLAPQTPVVMTDEIAQNLETIRTHRPARLALVDGCRVIRAGQQEISAMDTVVLRTGRLVTTADDRVTVRLTLTAWLAMLTAAHHTTTTEPDTWTRSASSDARQLTTVGVHPGRHAGMVRIGAAVASCRCGRFTVIGSDVANADARARGHRQDMAAAFAYGLLRATA